MFSREKMHTDLSSETEKNIPRHRISEGTNMRERARGREYNIRKRKGESTIDDFRRLEEASDGTSVLMEALQQLRRPAR
jgi:hypothetical protein